MNELLSVISQHTQMTAMLVVIGLTAIGMLVCLRKQHYLLQQIQRLQHDLRIANHVSIGMGQKIISLEKQLQGVNHSEQARASGLSYTISDALKAKEKNVDAPPLNNTFTAQIQSKISDKDHSQSKNEDKIEPSFNEKIKDSVGLLHSTVTADDNLMTARHLLKSGKKVSEVAEQCHLSFAEVSLLQALSQSKVSASSQLSP